MKTREKAGDSPAPWDEYHSMTGVYVQARREAWWRRALRAVGYGLFILGFVLGLTILVVSIARAQVTEVKGDTVTVHIPATITPDQVERETRTATLHVNGDTVTIERIPSVYVDEDQLKVPVNAPRLPRAIWEAAGRCFAEHAFPADPMRGSATPIAERRDPPRLAIVDGEALMIHDPTFDSLIGRWSVHGPYWAYSFVRDNVVVVVRGRESSEAILRHEATHFWIWDWQHRYGHPPEIFIPCVYGKESQ